jgi:Asp-tRNA(Asn)/Glu-tRNA(Gln) amidotransferase A subunit family amidase
MKTYNCCYLHSQEPPTLQLNAKRLQVFRIDSNQYNYLVYACMEDSILKIVSSGKAENGLPPPGFQLMGGALTEEMLCRIGYAYGQATGWSNQHPGW